MPNTNDMVYVRYTGSLPGSTNYKAPGMSRKYAFGMNPDHIQQRMKLSDYEALKKAYRKDFLLIPDEFLNTDLALHERISQFAAIDQADRDKMVNSGIVTTGQVMALGEQVLLRIFPDRSKVESIIDKLYAHYFGYEPSREVTPDKLDDLTAIARIGAATQKALNDMGIKTYDDVVNQLTIEAWLSLPGKTEESYAIVMESARKLAGDQ